MHIERGAIVAVVDGRKWLIYRNEGDSTRPVLEVLAHDKAVHGYARDFGSDQPGRTYGGPGATRSAYSETDFHQKAEEDFAKEAAARLNRMAMDGEMESLIVVATPRTLGVLRPEWHKRLREKLTAELPHEATQLTAGELVEMLEAHPAPKPPLV